MNACYSTYRAGGTRAASNSWAFVSRPYLLLPVQRPKLREANIVLSVVVHNVESMHLKKLFTAKVGLNRVHSQVCKLVDFRLLNIGDVLVPAGSSFGLHV